VIALRDETTIDVKPERLFTWLAYLQDNYLAWHPDHIKCELLKGTSILEVGAVLYFEEVLHGAHHKLTFRTTRVIPNRRLEYAAKFGLTGAFEVKPKEDGLLFIAELGVGTRFPVLSWLVDRILLSLFSDRLVAMRTHMVEEGENLKRLLEEEVQ
jgi:hypothetical protein